MTFSEIALRIATTKEFGVARQKNPDTSKEAAASIHVTGREQDVINVLERIGVGNSYDICDAISRMRGTYEIPSNITSRISSLVTKGKLEICGKKKSPMGRKCHVYKLVL
jgi:hypothetical protein